MIKIEESIGLQEYRPLKLIQCINKLVNNFSMMVLSLHHLTIPVVSVIITMKEARARIVKLLPSLTTNSIPRIK